MRLGTEAPAQEAERVGPDTRALCLEKALRELEARFDFAFENGALAMALLSPDGDFLKVNQAYCEMTGRSAAKMHGLHLSAVTHPDDHEQGRRSIERMLAGKIERLRAEKRYVHTDGRVIWGVVSSRLLRDSAGQPLAFFSQIQDITELKAAEAKARESEERLHLLAADATDFVVYRYRLLPELVCEYVSSGVEALTGYTPEEHYADPGLLMRIVHPEDRGVLLSGSRDAAEVARPKILRWVRPDGSLVWTQQRSRPIFDAEGLLVGLEGIAYDITARRDAEQALERRANYDGLTGLPNRHQFRDRLEAMLAERHDQVEPLAVASVGLERFETIGEAFGDAYTDQLLKEVAARLGSAVGEDQLLARTGPTTFAVLAGQPEHVMYYGRLAQGLLDAFEGPIVVDGQPFQIDVGVGVALFPGHGQGADVLIRRAERAGRSAEERNAGVVLYSSELDTATAEHITLLGGLRDAMESGQLELHYQPKVKLADRTVYGVEALMRWRHPEQGWIPPDRFIPLAEQSGLIGPLTLWAIDTAVRQMYDWHNAGLDLAVAVNITSRNLQDREFPDDVAGILERWGVPACSLWLELTERTVISDPALAAEGCQRLREIGVRLSLDDFGTGHSALAYLGSLPIDELKIDQAFVRELHTNANTVAIVRAIIDMASRLGRTTVAEGVEDQATLDTLAALKCDAAQGYLISKPLPPTDLLRWLAESEWGAGRPS